MTMISVTKIFVALCILGGIFAAKSGDIGFSCTPNASFKIECNTCVCSPNGKNAYCTQQVCRTRRQMPSRSLSGFRCIPDEYFKDKCNLRKCNSDGTYAGCTANACISKPYQPRIGAIAGVVTTLAGEAAIEAGMGAINGATRGEC